MNDMEEQLMNAMAAAIEVEGVPIVLIPYSGPPPEAEFYLDLMRYMIINTGEATGCLTFGTADGSSGMFPLMDIDPQTGLTLLIAMRQSGLLASVSWVTLASDAYRKTFDASVDPNSINHGDLTKMHEAGDVTVEDVLMVICVAPDGPGYDLSQTYHKTDNGIIWDEVLPPPENANSSGPIKRLMDDLVTA